MNVSRPATIRAQVEPPADKSISHRSLILNAIADGDARVENILGSEDVRSTADCLRALGVAIDWAPGSTSAVVHGAGIHGLFESSNVLDCGNSGTTMRLLAGLLAAHPLLSVLTGDDSLRSRPMGRVIGPLRAMGAQILGRMGDTQAPLVIKGGNLRGMHYASPVASAQVKSAITLAALYAEGETTITEPALSRDHTERMLATMGAPISTSGATVTVNAATRLGPLDVEVPGDISSAAPWLVLGVCHRDAEILVRNVNTNPTRTGLLDILVAMGADMSIGQQRLSGGEPVADITVRTSKLTGAVIDGDLVPRAIDELPLVAVLGAFAEGQTIVRDAAELRVKESDRVEAVVRALSHMGVQITPREDGFVVQGNRGALTATRIDAAGDHRIGMLGAVAGLVASGETRIDNDAVGVSYPSFWHEVEAIASGAVRA